MGFVENVNKLAKLLTPKFITSLENGVITEVDVSSKLDTTTYITGMVAIADEIAYTKATVEQSVATNYLSKTEYATATTAISEQFNAVSAEVSNTAARIVSSYQVYINDYLVYNITIYSTNGSMFRNGVISTILTAKVTKGREDITDTIPNTFFSWVRKSENFTEDTQWNAVHQSIGNILVIDTSDVYLKAVFSCVVIIQ
jgi:dGTP triphosphohydrolase